MQDSEELEEFFRDVYTRLKSRDNPLEERAVLSIMHRVIDGVRYLSDRYSHWWTEIAEGEIDVGDPDQAPYNLVIRRFQLQLTAAMWPSDKVSQEKGFVPICYEPAEVEALNVFWNAAIAELRADPVLKLAS
ncbi:MAG: hypothetical protein KGH68_03325 [Patescibacteria group bacterium]|nr:hypothetical protein [Patescibacteria group bacterium]